jgi:hypothetical protein
MQVVFVILNMLFTGFLSESPLLIPRTVAGPLTPVRASAVQEAVIPRGWIWCVATPARPCRVLTRVREGCTTSTCYAVRAGSGGLWVVERHGLGCHADGLFFMATNELKNLDFECDSAYCPYRTGASVSTRSSESTRVTAAPAYGPLLHEGRRPVDLLWCTRPNRPASPSRPHAGASIAMLVGLRLLLLSVQNKINHIKR